MVKLKLLYYLLFTVRHNNNEDFDDLKKMTEGFASIIKE